MRQDRTFSAIAEQILRRTHRSVEVINAGVSGFGTAEETLFFENEGLKYRPDVVVLGFYNNDFLDNIKAGFFKHEDGKLILLKHEHVPGVQVLSIINSSALLRWMSENSYFYSLIFNTVWESAKAALLGRERAAAAAELALSDEDAGNYEIDLALALIERLHAFCRAHGARLIVLDIPRPGTPGDFRSSIPPGRVDAFRAAADILIDSESLLSSYRGLVEFHRPHGQRHISEFSHLMFGWAIAGAIEGITSFPQ